MKDAIAFFALFALLLGFAIAAVYVIAAAVLPALRAL